MENKVTFRNAERKDTGLILQFVKELAAYEDMSDDVIADESILETWIFDKQKAEVLFAVVDGTEVGFALFFHNFSTFLGRAGLYLEDLFVMPEYRGKGYGKALLKKLASIAVERGCGRSASRTMLCFTTRIHPVASGTKPRYAARTAKALTATAP